LHGNIADRWSTSSTIQRGSVWSLVLFLSVFRPAPIACIEAQRPLVIEVDNDALNVGLFGQPSDGEYTHGMRLIVSLRGKSPMGEWLFPALAACGSETPTRACQDWNIVVGQQIYTPGPVPRRLWPTRRPFAGWLGTSIQTGIHGERVDHQVSLAVGVTGAASLAEHAQRWFHDMLAESTSPGWSEQLLSEPTLELGYRGTLRPMRSRLGERLTVNLRPVWGAAGGTVRTEVCAGLEAALALMTGADGGWPSVRGEHPTARAYVLGGIFTSWVGSDLFLDGGFLRHGRSVGHEDFVHVAEVGAGIQFQGRRIEWRVIRASRLYATQPEAHTYTTLSIAQ